MGSANDVPGRRHLSISVQIPFKNGVKFENLLEGLAAATSFSDSSRQAFAACTALSVVFQQLGWDFEWILGEKTSFWSLKYANLKRLVPFEKGFGIISLYVTYPHKIQEFWMKNILLSD